MANNIDRPNIADDEYKREIVRRIEAVLAEKESEKGAYLKRCQDFNARVDDLLEEAKAKGLPKKSLKGILKLREFNKKAEALRESLEDDQREILKSIEEALGAYIDTPLGAAAAAGANKATVGTAGPTTLEKGPGRGRRKAAEPEAAEPEKQDETTSAVVAAVLGTEDQQESASAGAGEQVDIEDEVEKRRQIDAQRQADAADFEASPPASRAAGEEPTAENVTRLDPAAARRNRTGGRTKSEQASEAARAAEETSAARAKEPTDQLKQAGGEPGKITF